MWASGRGRRGRPAPALLGPLGGGGGRWALAGSAPSPGSPPFRRIASRLGQLARPGPGPLPAQAVPCAFLMFSLHGHLLDPPGIRPPARPAACSEPITPTPGGPWASSRVHASPQRVGPKGVGFNLSVAREWPRSAGRSQPREPLCGETFLTSP